MNWEPWTGCYKISDGCTNCYFYGPHAKRYGQNNVEKTDKFDWPIRKNAKGEYNIKGNKILASCFATDFFLPEADEWRKEVWAMIRERTDIDFLILTKRIDRFLVSLPEDWGGGYDNVNIACAPPLEGIDLTPYLDGVEHVTVGGETGRDARECDYDWVLDIREQCVKADVTFWFKNTGSLFKYDGAVQKINPYKQTGMAKELGINILNGKRLF